MTSSPSSHFRFWEILHYDGFARSEVRPPVRDNPSPLQRPLQPDRGDVGPGEGLLAGQGGGQLHGDLQREGARSPQPHDKLQVWPQGQGT